MILTNILTIGASAPAEGERFVSKAFTIGARVQHYEIRYVVYTQMPNGLMCSSSDRDWPNMPARGGTYTDRERAQRKADRINKSVK